MGATDILMQEHRVIERVLDSLERAAGRLRDGRPMRPGFFLDAAEFIKGFADGCHHRKEEGALFPAMEAAGVPNQGGPIGVMLAEHQEGRRLTGAMRAAAERLEGGEVGAAAPLAGAALEYVALLRQHIFKEDNVLFPMAARVLPPEQQAAVGEAFEHVEREETGAGVHERFLALAEALAREAAG